MFKKWIELEVIISTLMHFIGFWSLKKIQLEIHLQEKIANMALHIHTIRYM
jgi:hypothetical protein